VAVSQFNDATKQTDWSTGRLVDWSMPGKARSMDYEPWPCPMFFRSNETFTRLSSRAMLYSMRLSIGQKKSAFN
jgi:hypothetical protein